MTEDEFNRCTDPRPMLEFLGGTGKATERKLRLFTTAVGRRVHSLLTRDYVRWCLKALEVRERHADGLAVETELRAADENANADAIDAAHAIAHPGEADYYAVAYAAKAAHARDPLDAARHAARAAAYDAVARLGDGTVQAISASWQEEPWQGRPRWDADEARVASTPGFLEGLAAERAAQAAVLRDLFGPLPFRPVAVPASVLAWSAGRVVKLAATIYEELALPGGTLDKHRLAVLADALEEAGLDDQEVVMHLRKQGGVHARGCWVVDLLLGKE